MSYPLESLEWKTLQFVADKVCNKADEDGVYALTEIERAYLFVWVADGEICGGTFHRFFHFYGEHFSLVPESYDCVGLPQLAQVVREAQAAFPYPADSPEERFQQLESLTEEEQSALDRLFGQYCKADGAINETLYQFIQNHRDELLPP